MDRLIQRHAARIAGILSGFDRLVLRGTRRQIAFSAGMLLFLCCRRILLKDFGAFAQTSTQLLRDASLAEAERRKRPVIHLPSPRVDQEAMARSIAQKDGVQDGLICGVESVEPRQSYEVFRNRDQKRLQPVNRRVRGLRAWSADDLALSTL